MVPFTEPFRVRRGTGAAYPDNIDGLTPQLAMAGTLCRLRERSRSRITADEDENEDVEHITIHSCVGRGGAPMADIRKHGRGIEYSASIFEARAIARLAAEVGAALVFDAVVLTHGEADALVGDDGEAYGSQVLQMQRDYAADLMGISGQRREPVLVLSQQNTCPPSRALRPGVMDAQWRVQNDDSAGKGKVVCSGPKYQYGYADGLHLTGGGYRRLGEKYGMVVHESVVVGREFRPLRPTRAGVEVKKGGQQVTVEFEVPVLPLRWNDCLPRAHGHGVHTAWKNGRGFEVRDAEGREVAIRDVVIAARESKVTIDLVEPAEKCPLTVAYAMTQQGDGFGSGFCGGTEDGRMGHLSDSADDGAVETLRCHAEKASHVLFSEDGWERRAVYDLMKPGGMVIVGFDPDDKKRAFMHEPWSGESEVLLARVRHDQRNYCVSFLMPVETRVPE